MRCNVAANLLYTRDIQWWREHRHTTKHPGRFPPTGVDRVLDAFVTQELKEDWKTVAQDRRRWEALLQRWLEVSA